MEADSRSVDVENALREVLEKFPAFAYPWEGLEDFMDSRGMSVLPLVGYGSLINKESAERTVNVDGVADRRAVTGYGAVRVFNYRIPSKLLEERYGIPAPSKNVSALNCEISGLAKDSFNGILTHVSRDRLGALREREKSYSLKPIVYRLWNESEGALEVAFVFELLPDKSGKTTPYDNSIFPHIAYTRLCQEGALAISPEFLAFFNETCFLADKKTRLSDYVLPEEG
ncbi:MAG: hypothetical protein ACI92G_001574 [Candidatus Pelagisphaera sp.]|jgi:hypothetical protein